MKLGMLSQWFDPEPGPAALPGIYAREIASRGHEVSVLTGFPNYPDGRLYQGFRIRPRSRRSENRIDVTRVALYPYHGPSAARRVANYGSFALSATAFGRPAMRDVDAVWVYNSPLTVSLPLLWHTKYGRTPFFLHVQDLWPESVTHSGLAPGGRAGALMDSTLRWLAKRTEHAATVIGVISPSVKDLLLERHPELDPASIVYAPNPADEALFQPIDAIRANLPKDREESHWVDVMYAGSIGEVQGLDTLLDAAALLPPDAHIRISLVGDGISRKRLERRVLDERIPHVHFLGRHPQEAIPGLIARSDIQVVSLADLPFLGYTTPSKIAALLASAVPVIGVVSGDGAELIRKSGAGAVVEPGSAERLAECIASMSAGGPDLWRTVGERGRRYYEDNLSVDATTGTILASLQQQQPL